MLGLLNSLFGHSATVALAAGVLALVIATALIASNIDYGVKERKIKRAYLFNDRDAIKAVHEELSLQGVSSWSAKTAIAELRSKQQLVFWGYFAFFAADALLVIAVYIVFWTDALG